MPLLSTDPITWTLDPTTNDFPPGPLTFTSGLAAVAQGIRTRLQLCAGEWFLNLDAGIPYLERAGVITKEQALYGQKFDANKTTAMFRSAIKQCPGVGSISAISCVFNNATRTITIAWAVVTSFGDTITDSLAIGAQ